MSVSDLWVESAVPLFGEKVIFTLARAFPDFRSFFFSDPVGWRCNVTLPAFVTFFRMDLMPLPVRRSVPARGTVTTSVAVPRFVLSFGLPTLSLPVCGPVLVGGLLAGGLLVGGLLVGGLFPGLFGQLEPQAGGVVATGG